MVVKRVNLFFGVVLVGLSSACADGTKDQMDKEAEKSQVENKTTQTKGNKMLQNSTATSPTSSTSKTVKVPQSDRVVQFTPPRIVEYDDEYPPVEQITDIDWSAKTQAGSDDYFGDVEPAPMPEIRANDNVLEIVDEPAEYPGGREAMSEYLKKNLMYPTIAKELEIQGKCYIRFIVNTDGSISDVRVVRGVPDCPECDKEAVRVVKNMPHWAPGKMNGKIVKSVFTLPIAFKLT